MPIDCLPPVIPQRPQLLVLGSMPSVASLRARQYYAHPRNDFWPIIAFLVETDTPSDYTDRIAMLKGARVALWDVLANCERSGSLDSAIRPQSEIANDIASLLKNQPTIRAIALNGGRAYACFKRHILPTLEKNRMPDILKLPSSSPANARLTSDQKRTAWSALRSYLA